ncbi:MAG TPA: hypothetical protein VGQ58_11215 [Candidatus Limnocylindrales bacterium]|jgi:hypothetical protein|nr:hypothetical protein [Candidatus Limnocylindrales bacterium]
MSDVVDEHSMCIARNVVMSTLRMRRRESEREFARAPDPRVIPNAHSARVGEY